MAGQGSSVDAQTLAIVVMIVNVVIIPLVVYIWSEHRRRVGELEKKAAGAAKSVDLEAMRAEFIERDRERRAEYREDMQRMEDKHQSEVIGLRKDMQGMADRLTGAIETNRRDVVDRVEIMGTGFEKQMGMLIGMIESMREQVAAAVTSSAAAATAAAAAATAAADAVEAASKRQHQR